MRQVIKLFGSKEKIESLLREINPYLPPYRIESVCLDTRVEFDEIEESDYLDLLDGLEEYVYSEEDITPEEHFIKFLSANKVSVATAESCTGGMIASSLVSVSGASRVFYEGVVTYNNGSKIDRLGVSEDTLSSFGAVSEQTAGEMAIGLISENVDCGISTTGIAGPEGGTATKPVGLVYIGMAYKDYPFDVYKFIFEGNRTEIRTSAKNAAIFKAWKFLENIL